MPEYAIFDKTQTAPGADSRANPIRKALGTTRQRTKSLAIAVAKARFGTNAEVVLFSLCRRLEQQDARTAGVIDI